MTLLSVWIKNGDKSVHLKKEVSFIPSIGLRIYTPITGVIGQATLDENGNYLAELESVLEPTNPQEQIDYLISIGFVKY